MPESSQQGAATEPEATGRETPATSALKLSGEFVRYCSICKLALNRPDRPESEDCGGDCLKCMAEIGEDPDCIARMQQLKEQT